MVPFEKVIKNKWHPVHAEFCGSDTGHMRLGFLICLYKQLLKKNFTFRGAVLNERKLGGKKPFCETETPQIIYDFALSITDAKQRRT